MDEQLAIIRERTEELIPEDELRRKLERSIATGTPLRVKQGFDPTAPDIHLGHTVGLQKCRDLQDLGHQVVLIVGDYTAQVGDPSGVTQTRRRLDEAEVRQHAQTYLEQYGRVIDLDRAEIRWNGEWFGKMSFQEVMELASRFTVRQVLEREDFESRYKAGKPISIHEIFYVLMQAWDSVMVRADIELGATEQKFNFLAARDLQKQMGQEPQVAITVPVLVGTDGTRRMSKSTGNYVGVAEPPGEQFGKVMSVPDSALPQWFGLVSGLDAAAQARWLAEGVNPRDAKIELGKRIVARFHGDEAAAAAAEAFRKQFGQKQLPDDIAEAFILPPPTPGSPISHPINTGIQDMVRSARGVSGSEARRLIAQGAVSIISGDGQTKYSDPSAHVSVVSGDILKVGKRRYYMLRWSSEAPPG